MFPARELDQHLLPKALAGWLDWASYPLPLHLLSEGDAIIHYLGTFTGLVIHQRRWIDQWMGTTSCQGEDNKSGAPAAKRVASTATENPTDQDGKQPFGS